jgi:hypothetical protein
MKKQILIYLGMIFLLNGLYGQIYSDFEAKSALRDWGVFSSNIIENAEIIIINGSEITGIGGMCISLPILVYINENEVITLNGSTMYITDGGRIVIEADLMSISGIIIRINGKKYFIVGKSLRDIANYIYYKYYSD